MPAADEGGTYVGVPNDYRVQVGYARSPQYDQIARHYGYNKPTYEGVYRSPVYTNSMLNSLLGKGPQQILSWQMAAHDLGYLPTYVPGVITDRTQNALTRLLTRANKNGMTVEQMLHTRKAAFKALGLTDSLSGGGGGGGGGGPRTVTQSSVNLTSREGAMQILQNALAQELGRKPTDTELTRFTRALNRKEAANPTVTTTHYSGDGSSVSSKTKQGNVDPNTSAESFAKTVSPAERNRFQDSQYLNVIANMIGVK